MSALWNDIKYAFRQLRKSPGFTAIALITLAIGIGATAAIVSVVKTVVFDPLPVSDSDRFLQLGHLNSEGTWNPGIYISQLQDMQQQTNLFAHVSPYSWDGLTLPGEVFPEEVPGMWVSAEFFRLWNLRPLLGRTFTDDEGQAGKDDVLVIGHSFWKSSFGGDPDIVGRSVVFQERPMTVVGVMPPHFSFPNNNYKYWRPVQNPDPATSHLVLQVGPNLRAIAEIQPGVKLSEVQAFLEVLTERARQDQLPMSDGITLQAHSLREMFIAPEVNRTLGLLLGAIVFVLLIAGANLANLQSARMETRLQELATRAALGAGRFRLFRQLLTESLLLAVLGGTAGLAVSVFGLDILQKLIPTDLPRAKSISLDLGVLGIASGVTLATGLLFGLGPALYGLRSNIIEVLKLGTAGGTGDHGQVRFNRVLIAGQLALVFVLLSGAGLMIRSVMSMLRVNPDLDSKHIVRVHPLLGEYMNRYYSPGIDLASDKRPEAFFTFFADAQQRIAAIPGVTAAGVQFNTGEVEVSVIPGSSTTTMEMQYVGVEEANPLSVLNVSLKQGRWLNRSDIQEGSRSILVNETAARKLWPGEEAIGKIFWVKEFIHDTAYEVVGVVDNTVDYYDRNRSGPQPILYPATQNRNLWITGYGHLLIRTTVNPADLYEQISQALFDAGADSEQLIFENLHESIWDSTVGHRTLMIYLIIFAGVSVLLAAIGLYGLLAYNVVRRTREIGLRIALGAEQTGILIMILKQGLVISSLGLVIGVLGAIGLTRFLTSYLYDVSPIDPATFVITILFITIVAMLACYIPARRAAKIDPMEALRYE